MNQLLTVEVAEFVDAVDAALADLPADARAELLEDLPDHLADVLADGASLRDQLGEPAAYAAELRAAAGLAPVEPAVRSRMDVAERLRELDARIGRAFGYERITEFFRALLPAWWLLRAYLAVQLVTGAHGRTGAGAVVPLVGGNPILGVIAVLAACAVSIWLGRRPAGRWAFATSVVVAVALLGYSTLLVQYAVRDGATVYVGDEGYHGPLDDVTDIYPVGPDGKVLRNVRLYDQDGAAILIGGGCGDSNTPGPADLPDTQLYPTVCDGATPVVPNSGPSALPSRYSTATASPTPARTTPTR